MAAATVTTERNQGLAVGHSISVIRCVAPGAGAGQTSFTVPAPRVRVGDDIMISPMNAGAAALMVTYLAHVACATAGTITVTFSSATLAGTEDFLIVAFPTQ
jgi:hypothetical protein